MKYEFSYFFQNSCYMRFIYLTFTSETLIEISY